VCGKDGKLPFDFDLHRTISLSYHLILAYVLAFPIGWDRERSVRSFGLRTFPLVAIAACSFVLVGQNVFFDNKEAQARVLQGVITGIGFIGGGAILKHKLQVTGTASAASIWNTGAIGIAIAFGRLEIALLLSALNFVTLKLIGRMKYDLEQNNSLEK